MEEYSINEELTIGKHVLQKGAQLYVIIEFPHMAHIQFRQDNKDKYTFTWEKPEDLEEILKKCKKIITAESEAEKTNSPKK